MAPEFIESQYENPAYPLERCTIYDAGSRAFWLPEYIEDLRDYWTEVSALAADGVSFSELLAERAPMLDEGRYPNTTLAALAEGQLAKFTGKSR